MSLTEYETTVVIRANVGGDAVESALDRMREVIKARNGKLLAINHWGKKKLAYEIDKQARGLYVHAHYLGGNDVVAEIERNFRINDQVLRFLTIRLNDQIMADEREEQAYVRPEYDADDADAEVEGDETEAEAGAEAASQAKGGAGGESNNEGSGEAGAQASVRAAARGGA